MQVERSIYIIIALTVLLMILIPWGLAHVLPDLPKAEVERLLREVPANVGRTVAELYCRGPGTLGPEPTNFFSEL